MLAVPLAFSLVLSLPGALSPVKAPSSPGSSPLAQSDELEEDFGDAPPLPEDLEGAPDPGVLEAPALPPPSVEDAPAAPPEEHAERDSEEPAEDGGAPLTGSSLSATQYGAAAGAFGVCAAAGFAGLCCGLACLPSISPSLVFSFPLIGPLLVAASASAIGAVGGAASGAIAATVGNAAGEDDVDLLWPAVTTAATGTTLMALAGTGYLLSDLNQPRFVGGPGLVCGALSLRFSSLLGGCLSAASLALCGAACVAAPLVGVFTYGLIAKEPSASPRADAPAPRRTRAPPAAVAMAY